MEEDLLERMQELEESQREQFEVVEKNQKQIMDMLHTILKKDQ
jgi:hypothetical protein